MSNVGRLTGWKAQYFRSFSVIENLCSGLILVVISLEFGQGAPSRIHFSRSEILQEVWGYTPERHVDTRVVDVHISRLRSKIEKDPSNPDLILTIRGKGYMFQNY